MITLKIIEEFLQNKEIAVIGASSDRKKFGNVILRFFKDRGFIFFPVNPGVKEIEDIKCFPDTKSLPHTVKDVVFTSKPEITEVLIKRIPRGSASG
ncbi:MAG: CoA-binding protein [Bacteroidota bacterium]